MVVATPGALEALKEAGDDLMLFLHRHLGGDWGNVNEADRRENDFSLGNGLRLLSSYTLSSGKEIWIITEADRSSAPASNRVLNQDLRQRGQAARGDSRNRGARLRSDSHDHDLRAGRPALASDDFNAGVQRDREDLRSTVWQADSLTEVLVGYRGYRNGLSDAAGF